MAHSFRSLRHRPYFRNAIYLVVAVTFLLMIYSWNNLRSGSYIPLSEINKELNEYKQPPAVWDRRAQEVKKAFAFVYHSYERHAIPHDELRPVTGKYDETFNGWGVSMIDTLDTMLIMGLDKEYSRTLPYIKDLTFTLQPGKSAPYFETVIRYLGGLISAYALKKDEILLKRADDLAEKLDPIFNTTSGLPRYAVEPSTGKSSGPNVGILAEIASLQLEYLALAKMTGKQKWNERADNVVKVLSQANTTLTGGMLPTGWDLTTGEPFDTRLSAGAQADSGHEYLLKTYLLSGKTDKASLEMYIRMTTHLITNLLYISPQRNLLYVTDINWNGPTHVFEHLSCFLPGLLVLGVHTLPLDNLASLGINLVELAKRAKYNKKITENYRLLSTYNLKDLHMWAAEGLMQTCWLTYADQPSGLGPDEIFFPSRKAEDGTYLEHGYLWTDTLEKWKKSGSRGAPPGTSDKPAVKPTEEQTEMGIGSPSEREYTLRRTDYLLRPETVESLYLMYRLTGDVKWRGRGWKIFEAIEKHTKTEYGYSSVKNVARLPTSKKNELPSYFFAETLKYLYLLFRNDDLIPLDKWVFNTEAHPFPIN